VAFWASALGGYQQTTSPEGHYVLLYQSIAAPQEVQSWLKRLENNYKAFYYWFALKGQALPVAHQQLLAVLVESGEAYNIIQQQICPGATTEADGCLNRRENLAIFSSEPLDQGYNALKQSTNDMWTSGWNKSDLLKGAIRQDLANGFAASAQAQMIALLLQALREEAEIASVSYEGTRQLLAAANLLPRDVKVPRWIDFGMGSFFETSKEAYWFSVGAPSWKFLPRFQAMDKAGKLDPPAKALLNVVTDRYFRESGGPSVNSAALLKAQTMAWSLTYFLMQRHTDGMLRYFQELSNLPRDMPIDENAYFLAFVRAFQLVDPAQASDFSQIKGDDINLMKLKTFGEEWFTEIRNAQLEFNEATVDAIRAYNERFQRRRPGQ
jgi:hypothetical protein